MSDYDSSKFKETVLGSIKAGGKQFIRVTRIEDENGNISVDIRKGFVKDDKDVLTAKGIRFNTEFIPEIIAKLEEARKN